MMRARLANFARLPAGDMALTLAAITAMGASAALVRAVPIRRIAPFLGKPLGPVCYVPLASPAATRRAGRLRAAIARAARTVPWRNDCSPQALAGVMLGRLLRIPVAMHLGVRLGGEREPEAHAWLASGRIAITGGPGHASHTAVACFLSE